MYNLKLLEMPAKRVSKVITESGRKKVHPAAKRLGKKTLIIITLYLPPKPLYKDMRERLSQYSVKSRDLSHTFYSLLEGKKIIYDIMDS